jgi:membrane protease subunit HflK
VPEDAGAQALADALRSSFLIVKFLMVLLVGAFIVSGIFTVKPNQVAVVLRFGKPVGVGQQEQLLQPGLHWAWPYPIDEIVYIPVGESHTVTSTAGWYYVTPEEEASGQRPQELPYLRPGVDGSTLTGDGNIIHVRTTLNYRISDPLRYAFHFARSTNLLQHLLDNAILYAAARFNADDALYRNKLAFQEAVIARVTALNDQLQLGITIDPREVRTSPPLAVESAFTDVLKAQQKGDIQVREAESYARGATNRAVAEATAILRDGLTASNYFVQTVAAEAVSFDGQLVNYQRDPELFRRRRLAEATEQVLTNAAFKLFLPQRADGQRRELRLQLNREPVVPTPPGSSPPR